MNFAYLYSVSNHITILVLFEGSFLKGDEWVLSLMESFTGGFTEHELGLVGFEVSADGVNAGESWGAVSRLLLLGIVSAPATFGGGNSSTTEASSKSRGSLKETIVECQTKSVIEEETIVEEESIVKTKSKSESSATSEATAKTTSLEKGCISSETESVVEEETIISKSKSETKSTIEGKTVIEGKSVSEWETKAIISNSQNITEHLSVEVEDVKVVSSVKSDEVASSVVLTFSLKVDSDGGGENCSNEFHLNLNQSGKIMVML